MHRAAFYLACGSAVASLVSIAVCQILMGGALLAILASRERLRLPPIALPLGFFLLWTLLAVAVSDDPRAGLPQVKKIFVYLMLPIIFTAIRRTEDIRHLIWWWAAAASVSGLWSFVQFWTKKQTALAQNSDFYLLYVGDRVTGLMSHWMTFGAVQMTVLSLLLSLLLLSRPPRYRWPAFAAVAVISASIIIGWTRSVWLGAAIAVAYLVAVWRPKYLLLTPLLLIVCWFISPRSVRARVMSIYQPHGEIDSNLHRNITRRVGIEMIKAHPWFGIGPEMPGKEFDRYLPPDIKKPLPHGFYGHLHNVYLQFGAERGIPALIAFLWMIGKMLTDWWRRARSSITTQNRAILHGCIAALVAILIEALFEHNLGDSEVLSMFWVVVAWGYCAWQEVEA